MTLNVPNDIINDTPADALPINANYTAIEQYVNQNLVNRDGTTQMTGQLTLVGDPISDNHAARKAYVDAVLPVGVMLPWLGVGAPAGEWALANGAALQTTLYPKLYNILGTRYGGSGGSFNLPNMTGVVPIGVDGRAAPDGDARFAVVGKTGGTFAASLLEHTHPIDHDHGAAASAGASVRHTHTMSHNHTINHDHAASTTSAAGAHSHEPSTGDGFYAYSSGGGDTSSIVNPTGSFDARGAGTTATAPAHTHAVGINAFAGNSGFNSVGSTANDTPDHTHQVNLPAFAGASKATGTAAAEQVPPYVTINYIVRIA